MSWKYFITLLSGLSLKSRFMQFYASDIKNKADIQINDIEALDKVWSVI